MQFDSLLQQFFNSKLQKENAVSTSLREAGRKILLNAETMYLLNKLNFVFALYTDISL